MYCAYTIPGMTGSSLMYYYNGKAVGNTFPIFFSIHCLFPSAARGCVAREASVNVGVCVFEKERERGGRQREMGEKS